MSELQNQGGSMIPALVLTYGNSGGGKTVDCGYSFPNALFIAVRGALQSIEHTCGYTPAMVTARTIMEATHYLLRYKELGGEYDAIVVDDFSYLAEQTMADLEQNHKGFKLWSALRDATLDFREAARYADCHVILNCWDKVPSTKNDGTFVRGGPMLSGKLPEQLPAMCDLVLRCGMEPMRKPWKGVYLCEQSSQYVMKDRFKKCYDLSPIPMNLGEILRASGFQISRLKTLPWQEEVVENLAQQLLGHDKPLHLANELYSQLLEKGIEIAAAQWTIRDALDRSVIRASLNQSEKTFI